MDTKDVKTSNTKVANENVPLSVMPNIDSCIDRDLIGRLKLYSDIIKKYVELPDNFVGEVTGIYSVNKTTQSITQYVDGGSIEIEFKDNIPIRITTITSHNNGSHVEENLVINYKNCYRHGEEVLNIIEISLDIDGYDVVGQNSISTNEIFSWNNGLKDGPYKFDSPNGSIEGQYLDDKRYGLWVERKGDKVISSDYYINDQIVDPEVYKKEVDKLLNSYIAPVQGVKVSQGKVVTQYLDEEDVSRK